MTGGSSCYHSLSGVLTVKWRQHQSHNFSLHHTPPTVLVSATRCFPRLTIYRFHSQYRNVDKICISFQYTNLPYIYTESACCQLQHNSNLSNNMQPLQVGHYLIARSMHVLDTSSSLPASVYRNLVACMVSCALNYKVMESLRS